MNLIVHTDGGARGNPGPAAIGVVIEAINANLTSEKKKIIEISQRIGETTNNVAEYTAVIRALEEIRNQINKLNSGDNLKINFFLDSTLVVNQLNGLFRVKDAKLRNLLLKAKQLEQEVGGEIHYLYVPREQNRRADILVNKALDNV